MIRHQLAQTGDDVRYDKIVLKCTDTTSITVPERYMVLIIYSKAISIQQQINSSRQILPVSNKPVEPDQIRPAPLIID